MVTNMNGKHSILVKNDEKELYRIYKDLEKHSRSVFSYPTNPGKQQSIARTIGIRGKPLVEQGLFLPPASNRYCHINIVALPIGVSIKEEKTSKGSRFFFHRE